MRRFHAHVAVENIEANIEFYSKLFGQPPTRKQAEYAKWMMEDPRINFAISARGSAVGLNHFGFQADSAGELAELRILADAASVGEVLDQGNSTCCYSNSDKHWTIDPQGLAWEHFYTMSEALEFGNDTANQTGACCIPLRGSDQDAPPSKAACCILTGSSAAEGACCA
jgi:catechol 2,3-dioxygenase-like lactoylglutathione lyase family enzyme